MTDTLNINTDSTKTTTITITTSPNSSASSNSNNNNNNTKNNESLTEKDIALDLLNGSKATVTSLAKTLTETTNPQLRDALKNQLTLCINSHHRLSDLTINKGWYNAYAEPEQQLQQDLSSAKAEIQ